MERIKIETIVTAINHAMHDAWKTFADYESALMSKPSDPEIYEDMLEYQIKGLYVQLSFALEILQLNSLLLDFKEGFKPYQNKLTSIKVNTLGDPYPPSLVYLQSYLQPLRAAVGKTDNGIDGLQQLERILLGTPKIIKDRQLEPKNESEVRNAIYQLLLHPYPDTVRNISIAKVSKCYKPDIGIHSLKAAIEYKFCDTEQEVKKAIGGVYEDVCGYGGIEDWRHFYAVFYMTDAFLTQSQVEAEFRMSNVDHTWKPILVTGKGARHRRD